MKPRLRGSSWEVQIRYFFSSKQSFIHPFIFQQAQSKSIRSLVIGSVQMIMGGPPSQFRKKPKHYLQLVLAHPDYRKCLPHPKVMALRAWGTQERGCGLQIDPELMGTLLNITSSSPVIGLDLGVVCSTLLLKHKSLPRCHQKPAYYFMRDRMWCVGRPISLFDGMHPMFMGCIPSRLCLKPFDPAD
jgi:hypothetical protein